MPEAEEANMNERIGWFLRTGRADASLVSGVP
jgi:hypothetical protein